MWVSTQTPCPGFFAHKDIFDLTQTGGKDLKLLAPDGRAD
jgi:hypothetical protein